jgi:molybdopterin-guanine dinucleotide biosynthesis protein A
MPIGALILMGGGSVRMGADKAALIWNGVSARERCIRLARAVGAELVLAVGGAGDVPDDLPGGGPVGGILAGVQRLVDAGYGRVLVLAVDAPTARPGDLTPLLDAPGDGAAYEGLHLPMVFEADALPVDPEPGWPVARLVERAGLARPACAPEAVLRLRGANTPDERAALLAALIAHEGAQQSGEG